MSIRHAVHQSLQYLKRVPWPLFVLGFAALLLMGIQEIADEVMEGETRGVDTYLLMSLREAGDPANPIGPRWLEEVMRDMSALGGIAILTLVVCGTAIYLLLQKRYLLTGYVALSTIFGTVLSNVLKAGFDRPRPDLIPHDIIVYTASFPSGHAMMSASVYLTLGTLLAEAQDRYRIRVFWIFWAIFLTLTIGISRVYLGVHWPSDVLAGWMTGTLWATLCWLGLRWIERRQRV
jgi:undecaprenyl-diphosphatase